MTRTCYDTYLSLVMFIKNFQLMLQNETLFYDYISLLKDFAQSTEASKEDLYMKVEIKLDDYLESIKEKSETTS